MKESGRFAGVMRVPDDFPSQIRRIRARLGFTQVRLAEALGVSFATVNRWENAQVKPSKLFWAQLLKLVSSVDPAVAEAAAIPAPLDLLDFTAPPDVVRIVAEGARLSFGHLANPAFATETSKIDPLPHQRIAVYEHMLAQPRLRFLLADDAGAGKTIMAGLYIRERQSRRLLRRTLIVPPAGLVGNWRRELANLFGLSFRIVSGADAKIGNPFVGDAGNQVIVSIDTLRSARVFARLAEPEVDPYDLVIFDEAHKLAASRGADMRVTRTDRYRLAEALAGAPTRDEEWRLPWSAQHLLLLTATPHMGKDYPYYALWRLLEPDILSTQEAFDAFDPVHRSRHFIRRTKEEMVRLDGTPLYPERVSDTLGYTLTQGELSEQRLYDETTDYLRFVYNKAKLLNRTAARLAMSVFQRRLASSTFALLRSFDRRLEKLERLIADVQDGRITLEQLITFQHRLGQEPDPFDSGTADEEGGDEGLESNEVKEDKLLQGIVAASLGDLYAERERVAQLAELARKVHEQPGTESKFDRLEQVLRDPRWSGEKLIVFTEHRDTLMYLVRRLEGLGHTGQVAQIHGGMDYQEREEQVERFRRPEAEGGCRILVATDAAGEGINLQFCWLMVNWDIPWNPARLEQRMGRIHRYGQAHDPVVILNLVAPGTREGLVLKTLLDKLEAIRKALRSDKVFDVIGRVFNDVSITRYMELALEEGGDAAAERLAGSLTEEQVAAVAAREQALCGSGGDVAKELPRLRDGLEQEAYRRLLPGYVQRFLEEAAPRIGLAVEGDAGTGFSLKPEHPGALDKLLPILETYPPAVRHHLATVRPADSGHAVWFHPSEAIFEAFRGLVEEKLSGLACQGAVFVDPGTDRPYLFHLARVSAVRQADGELPGLSAESAVECRLVGVRQFEGADIELCAVEHLLLLRGSTGLPASGQRLAANALALREQAAAFVAERVARELAISGRKSILAQLEERERLVRRGFDFREADLAALRALLTEKARGGNKGAALELAKVKNEQRTLAAERDRTLLALRREPDLVVAGPVHFLAHALVVPSSDPEDRKAVEAKAEELAMQLARAFEEAANATVHDVHTPPLARAAGLTDSPGFDLLAIHPSGERRSIEVKGLSATGAVEVSENEWARACNLRDRYWLYVAYDCASPAPRLVRVQDPFGRLLAKAKGSVLVNASDILAAGHQESSIGTRGNETHD